LEILNGRETGLKFPNCTKMRFPLRPTDTVPDSDENRRARSSETEPEPEKGSPRKRAYRFICQDCQPFRAFRETERKHARESPEPSPQWGIRLAIRSDLHRLGVLSR
jgi:hypothetical protein